MSVNARDRLILALDVIPEEPRGRASQDDPVGMLYFLDQLDDLISVVKIGWPVFMRWGIPLAVETLKQKGKRIFLDAKFTDLSSWATDLVHQCEDMGVSFLTVNHGWDTVEAAVKGKTASSALKIFTLTLLTSLDQAELVAQGNRKSVEEVVVERARTARDIGCDGVISSGREVDAIRKAIPDKDFLIVTPGIRPAGSSHDDQKRVATPSTAVMAGADYLVVGRPITQALDPKAATIAILREMQDAFDRRP